MNNTRELQVKARGLVAGPAHILRKGGYGFFNYLARFIKAGARRWFQQ